MDDKAFAQRAYDKLLGSGKRKSSDPESMDASASGGAADGAPMVSGPPDSGDKETDSGLPVEIPGIVSPAPLLCKQVCERIINECGATGDTRDCTAYCESSVSETEALCVAGAASCKAMCGACFPCE